MTDVPAAARARRVSALFARYGETFTLTTAGVSRTVVGLFTPMDAPTLGTYFDGNEAVGLLHPALSLYADGALADPPVANDVFTRDGRLQTMCSLVTAGSGPFARLIFFAWSTRRH